MATLRLEERFAFSGGTVDLSDPEHPFVRGVKLCGSKSENRRRYLPSTFEGNEVKKYANSINYLNHGKRGENREYESKLSTTVNERVENGLPVGDLAVNPKHPYAAAFLWDAQNNPGVIGMSHVAECDMRRGADGWDEITKLIRVESVDIVIGPATTTGLFTAEGKTVAKTITEVVEWVTRHPKSTTQQILRAKLLAEWDDGAMAATPVADAPVEDADPEDGLTAAFKAYLIAHVEALIDGSQTIEEFLKKVKDAHKAHAGKGEKSGAETVSGGADDDTSTEESKKAKLAAELPYTVFAECKAKNYDPTPQVMKYLATLTVEDRTAFITEQAAIPGKGAERIQSAARRPGAGSAGAGPRVVQTETVTEQRLIPAWN